MKDFTGKPVAVGDIVVFNRPYYKDLCSSPVLKITPKGIKAKYKNNFGEYETFIAEGQFVVIESINGGLIKQTNFERIKAMTIDEMADFLMDFVTEALTNPRCIVVKNWLKDEVQEDDR